MLLAALEDGVNVYVRRQRFECGGEQDGYGLTVRSYRNGPMRRRLTPGGETMPLSVARVCNIPPGSLPTSGLTRKLRPGSLRKRRPRTGTWTRSCAPSGSWCASCVACARCCATRVAEDCRTGSLAGCAAIAPPARFVTTAKRGHPLIAAGSDAGQPLSRRPAMST